MGAIEGLEVFGTLLRVGFQLVLETPETDSQDFSGPGAAPIHGAQRSQDVLLFYFAQREPERRGLCGTRHLLGLVLVERKDVGVDRIFFCKHQRLLDAVLKLPYVTRPAI